MKKTDKSTTLDRQHRDHTRIGARLEEGFGLCLDSEDCERPPVSILTGMSLGDAIKLGTAALAPCGDGSGW